MQFFGVQGEFHGFSCLNFHENAEFFMKMVYENYELVKINEN